MVHPVERLAADARAFEEGRLDHPVAVAGSDEIAQLARAFENMRASLDRLLRDLRQRQRQLEEANVRLEELATTDLLTGLRTRRYLQEWLPAEVVRCDRFGHDLGCLMLDIDDFKRINDKFGHPVGDKVLAAFAAVLRHNLRAFDLGVRYGGEEFLVLLPQTALEQATEVAGRIRDAVARERYDTDGQQASLTVSIGVSSVRTIAPGPDRGQRLIERADLALYGAKRRGKDAVVPWHEEGKPPDTERL